VNTDTAYKALIFDLGKVIFDYSFDLCFWNWGKFAGLERDVVRKRFEFDEAYGLFSKGDLTETEYAAHVSKLIGYELSQEQFETGWNSIYLDYFPGIVKLLRAVKKNYRIVCLSNTNVTHARVWRTKYEEAIVEFEKVFCSFEMRTRKPEAKAYTLVLDYLRLPAGEVIFLDDKPGNIIGASDVGIKGIIVGSTSQMIESLQQLEIKF
jgi:glucose-1-phosphatase